MTSEQEKTLERSGNEEDARGKGMKAWLTRIGLAGFLFFFIKGLVWLAVFFGLFKACN